MVTEKLFEKIMARISTNPEERQRIVKDRMNALNERLTKQLESQKMTEEVLNKRCTI